MKKIILLTNAYPFSPGEQFIEDEIGHWANAKGVKVTVVPLFAHGEPRSVPPGVGVDIRLTKWRHPGLRVKAFMLSVISPLLWKEFAFIKSSKGLNLSCCALAFREVSKIIGIKMALKEILKTDGLADVAYCYWNDSQSYAAILLRRSNLIKKVVSRAHGFDLYEARRPNHYMPLKRQFINELDLILPVSRQGKKYLEEIYGAPSEKVLVSRLGVPIPEGISQPSSVTKLNIVSVSFCSRVKRIDKIIDAIAEAALSLRDRNISWSHIGGGELLAELRRYAKIKLTPLGVNWGFFGDKANAEVKSYFLDNSVDIFINASESEGVPVSIMEAMSCGVPVIAPNVGGVAELVANEYGYLLSEDPCVGEMAEAIVRSSLPCKDYKIRALAKKKITEDYSAARNYSNVINLLTNYK